MSSRNPTVILHSRFIQGVPVKASTIIRKGEIVARITATGFVIPMDVAAGRTALGIADETVDNSAGADGDKTIRVEQGVFLLKNAGTNTLTGIHLGSTCYGEVAETSTVEGAVGSDSTNKVPVGPVVGLGYSGETGVQVRIES